MPSGRLDLGSRREVNVYDGRGGDVWIPGSVVGFEDSFDGEVDHDYNDVVFAVRGATLVPEPVTMSLLATGLAGMGGASVVRRSRRK